MNLRALLLAAALGLGGLAAQGGALAQAPPRAAPAAPAAVKAGDQCAGLIQNNAAAAGVCGPACAGANLKFNGQWSNDRNFPPVQACMKDKNLPSICGCAAEPAAQAAAPPMTLVEMRGRATDLAITTRGDAYMLDTVGGLWKVVAGRFSKAPSQAIS